MQKAADAGNTDAKQALSRLEREEKERLEAKRREKERLEAERLAKERLEAEPPLASTDHIRPVAATPAKTKSERPPVEVPKVVYPWPTVPVRPEREKLLPPIFFNVLVPALLVLAGGLILLLAFMYYPESKLLTTFQGHTAVVNGAVFSSDGRRVLTASGDRTARLWEAETGKLLVTFQGHTSDVISAVFSPDGRRVLTASGRLEWIHPTNTTVRLWEAETGKLLAVFQGHTGGVCSAVFSPDGRRVLTASWDNTARLWEARILNPGRSQP